MLREGMFIAERYEVLEKIGSGGMSDVYRAKCHKLNRFVAIKVLKNEFSEDKTFVSKFRDEAQSAAGLMHANIVNVYDVGEENGIYYIVMELVEGITLKKYIEKKGILGVRESVSISIQVAQGMDAAHSHHIVHRDIKPQNIIISKEGKVKVTDFGIARAASSNTINSTVMGSVHYISPEQARGGYSDEKSDIYSFGIMLFEMLTGRVPFEGDTTVAIALQHIQDDIISPKEIVSEIPVSVEKIVLKCTQKKTEKRYQNAMDLIADLKRSLVTPDEDFVVIASSVSNDAPTQMIDQEDMAQITQKAGVKSAGLDVISPVHNDDYDRKSYEEVENMSDYDDYDEDDRDIAASKKIDKIIAILGIAVGAVIIIITIIVIVKMVGYFSESNTSTPGIIETTVNNEDGLVEVPNLKGYTYDEAKKVLNAAGLGINEIYAHSDSYKEGVIFEQDYEQGQRVKPNTTIRVTISKGAVTFELPSVIGNTQSLAETTLKNKDLKVSYKYEVTETEDLWGTVKSSDPIAGTSVKSGDVITLVIYMGPEVVNEKVPDVVGKTLEEAKKILADLKFDNITCEYEFDEEVEKDSIVSLSGAQIGEKAPITTPITLVVSKGPEEIKAEIPEEIIGMNFEDAVKELEKLGFDKEKITSKEEFSSEVEAGKVISVNGASLNEKIPVETEIELVVSKGEEETTTQEPTTEEPTTEEPTTEPPSEDGTTESTEPPSETEKAVSATIATTVRLSDIRASFVDTDESKPVKLTYYATYVDATGANVVRKVISSPGEYSDYNTMIDSAPFNLNVPVDNAKAGDAVTIEVDITYYKTGQEETTTVTATVVSTFQ